MFTGLIEEVGRVAAVEATGASARICVEAPRVAEGTSVGDSVAIDGVCLTVVAGSASRLEFDAVPETMRRTTLGLRRTGDAVNLERALAVGQRLGGHFVQGHVDVAGTLLAVTREGNARVLRIGLPAEHLRLVAEKGSVAIDGISLTVASLDTGAFTVAIIPHTWENTTLHARRAGDRLNVETDVLAKYVDRLSASAGRSDWKLEFLADA